MTFRKEILPQTVSGKGKVFMLSRYLMPHKKEERKRLANSVLAQVRGDYTEDLDFKGINRLFYWVCF